MSDADIEAAAAAIVAQAASAPPDHQLPDAGDMGFMASALPDAPQLDEIRGRNRFWLTLGVICCVVFVIMTILLTRVIASAPH